VRCKTAPPLRYNRRVSAARRTLGRWLLAAFLERGCETTARTPRRVFAIRPLTARELADLQPFADPLVPLHNLRLLSSRLPRAAAHGPV
jgi:hypothetical protein